MKKKGLSEVVSTVLLILITIALIAGIWAVINTFVSEKLEGTKACYGLYEKVSINDEFTCFNSTGNYTKVSIKIGDIDIDSLLISVSYGNNNDVFELTNTSQIIPKITYYKPINSEVKIPGKESGKTYIINSTTRPEKIELAPKVGNEQCDITDKTESVPTCM